MSNHTSNTAPITREDWGQAPNNRWSFQHMQSLFPTRRIARHGSQAAFEYPVKSQDINSFSYVGLTGEPVTIKSMLENSYTDSFLVVKSGVIVSEQYFNNMTHDSQHLINSVTKSFVGMLAGIAVEQGLLNPELPVREYLPNLDNSAWEGTTVRQLLDMTAGVDYQEVYSEPETDFWKESAVIGWRDALVDESTPATLFDYARSLEGKDQQDGEKLHYRTLATNVLGMVLEKAMGKDLGTSLSEDIWSKLHPRHDANIIVDKTGCLYVGAGMSATTRDLANFGLAMINNGKLDDQQVLPESWIKDTLAGDSTSRQCFQDSDYGKFGFSHYRNQVWVKDSEKGIMLAIGIHGQFIYMDKSNDLVMVKLSSQPESTDELMYLDAIMAMDAIAEQL